MRPHRTFKSFIPVLLSVLSLVACVGGIALAARFLAFALWEHPYVANVAVYSLATVGAIAGLVIFWYGATYAAFFVRGHCVRGVNRKHEPALWLYEERMPDGAIASMPIVCKPLGEEYYAPCEIHLPSQEVWNSTAPLWARDRRSEIVANIATELGAGGNRPVTFVDL